MRLTHVRLLVDDYAACFRFYRDEMGLEVAFGDEDGPYADFAAGDASVALFERGPQARAADLRAPGDGSLVVLAVEDVDAEARRLRRHVVAGPAENADWGIRFVYVRDPAGNLLELNQPLA